MLKYLFTAIYNDGTEYKQTEADVSTQDPSRSAFFDIDHNKLDVFVLHNEETAVEVDLVNGNFAVNGAIFSAYDGEIKDRRLVYFRRNVLNFNGDFEEVGHDIAFHVGWQGNDPVSGENIQRVLALS